MQESTSVANANKFTPKPGDKIICDNGEEFICCTLEFLKETFHDSLTPSEAILGYNESWSEWQSWDFNGQAEWGGLRYHIREVIPQSSETLTDKKEKIKEEPRYTMQEIKEAWDASGWVISTSAWEAFQKNLLKINSPEYQEYLRLKAIYE